MLRASVALVVLLATPASAQIDDELGIFVQEACSLSSVEHKIGDRFELYVTINMRGNLIPSACLEPSIAVRLRITGIPEDWKVSLTPSPDAVFHDGDPLEPSGGKVEVPFQGSRCLILYTVNVESTVDGGTYELGLAGPGGECPEIKRKAMNCDGWWYCAQSVGSIVVNLTANTPVRRTSWSRLKIFF